MCFMYPAIDLFIYLMEAIKNNDTSLLAVRGFSVFLSNNIERYPMANIKQSIIELHIWVHIVLSNMMYEDFLVTRV